MGLKQLPLHNELEPLNVDTYVYTFSPGPNLPLKKKHLFKQDTFCWSQNVRKLDLLNKHTVKILPCSRLYMHALVYTFYSVGVRNYNKPFRLFQFPSMMKVMKEESCFFCLSFYEYISDTGKKTPPWS